MKRMLRVARQTTFFLFPILIIPVPDMESPQRDPWHPTLPTTIHAGPDSTHDETDYHLPILRMYAIQISPELRYMRHPTLYQHHPYMPAMTSCRDAHPGMPYLAVPGTTLGPITCHRAGQYCITEIRTISCHLCPITTRRAKRQKDSKMSHPLYTILPHFSIFVRKFYFCPNFTHWYSLKISNLRIF